MTLSLRSQNSYHRFQRHHSPWNSQHYSYRNYDKPTIKQTFKASELDVKMMATATATATATKRMRFNQEGNNSNNNKNLFYWECIIKDLQTLWIRPKENYHHDVVVLTKQPQMKRNTHNSCHNNNNHQNKKRTMIINKNDVIYKEGRQQQPSSLQKRHQQQHDDTVYYDILLSIKNNFNQQLQTTAIVLPDNNNIGVIKYNIEHSLYSAIDNYKRFQQNKQHHQTTKNMRRRNNKKKTTTAVVKDRKILQSSSSSYGILCVTAQYPYYVVMNCSPSYTSSNIIKNENKCQKNKGMTILNSNEVYNLIVSSFPGGTGEGQYTIPRGKMDHIDGKNKTITKIREFVEETKLSHPRLLQYVQPLSTEDKQSSSLDIFTNSHYTVTEKWLGLDNRTYEAEYTIFVIKDINELIQVANPSSGAVDYDYFIDKKFVTNKLFDKHKQKYEYDIQLDTLKQTVFMPLQQGLQHLKDHRLFTMEEVDYNKIVTAIEAFKK